MENICEHCASAFDDEDSGTVCDGCGCWVCDDCMDSIVKCKSEFSKAKQRIHKLEAKRKVKQ